MINFETNFFLDFFILSFEFIYCHILIFKVKFLNFSIQNWKLFEIKIVSSPQLVTRNVVTVDYVDAWVRWWMIFD
jgi:hypothetical protein